MQFLMGAGVFATGVLFGAVIALSSVKNNSKAGGDISDIER